MFVIGHPREKRAGEGAERAAPLISETASPPLALPRAPLDFPSSFILFSFVPRLRRCCCFFRVRVVYTFTSTLSVLFSLPLSLSLSRLSCMWTGEKARVDTLVRVAGSLRQVPAPRLLRWVLNKISDYRVQTRVCIHWQRANEESNRKEKKRRE